MTVSAIEFLAASPRLKKGAVPSHSCNFNCVVLPGTLELMAHAYPQRLSAKDYGVAFLPWMLATQHSWGSQWPLSNACGDTELLSSRRIAAAGLCAALAKARCGLRRAAAAVQRSSGQVRCSSVAWYGR